MARGNGKARARARTSWPRCSTPTSPRSRPAGRWIPRSGSAAIRPSPGGSAPACGACTWSRPPPKRWPPHPDRAVWAPGRPGGSAPSGGDDDTPRIGDFRIVRELGRGGMGVVYEAVEGSLGRRVALKVLPFAAAIDPRQIARFRVEAQAASHLNHPHIVPVFSVGCEGGIHYYAMQLIDGPTLARPDRRPAPPGRDRRRDPDQGDDRSRRRAGERPGRRRAWTGFRRRGFRTRFALGGAATATRAPRGDAGAFDLAAGLDRDPRSLLLPRGRPGWARGCTRARACAPAGRAASRRQAVEPDGRRPGPPLGHRLRPGPVPGRGEPDGARRPRWARCAT